MWKYAKQDVRHDSRVLEGKEKELKTKYRIAFLNPSIGITGKPRLDAGRILQACNNVSFKSSEEIGINFGRLMPDLTGKPWIHIGGRINATRLISVAGYPSVLQWEEALSEIQKQSEAP